MSAFRYSALSWAAQIRTSWPMSSSRHQSDRHGDHSGGREDGGSCWRGCRHRARCRGWRASSALREAVLSRVGCGRDRSTGSTLGRLSACPGYRSRGHRRRAGAGGRAGAGSGRGAPGNPFRGHPRINGVRCLQEGITRGIWRGHHRYRCLYREIRARPSHRVPRTLHALGSARPALSVAVSRRRRHLPRGRRQGSSGLLPAGRWAKCRPHQQSANGCGGGGVGHPRSKGGSPGEASTRPVARRCGRVTARRTRTRLHVRSTLHLRDHFHHGPSPGIPPIMLKTTANPGGLPMEVFDGLRQQLAANRSQFYRDLASGPFYSYNRPGAKVLQSVIDNWWRQAMMGGANAHYEGIKAFSETDFTEDLKAISVPTLVMHGDDDQIVPYKDAALLSVKLLSRGTLKVYPGFPHGMLTTHADVINEDLLTFIEA